MANICNNIFYCRTDNVENYQKIGDFLKEEFSCDYIDESSNFIESVFDSSWSFPEKSFEELLSILAPDLTLYMRVLSYEFGCEYVSYRIYQNGEWEIKY